MLPVRQNFSPQALNLTITVIPCGREDFSLNSPSEQPYELTLKRKVNEQNNLKEIFLEDNSTWEAIYKPHLQSESQPNFSVYRTLFDPDGENSHPEMYLHILYMKSSEKTLTRNYNAQELELFCHNRFYGPLVVALNQNKSPYQLLPFTLKDLANIETINKNFQNKSIKDDFVPDCLLAFSFLKKNLVELYNKEERYIFFMFHYKTSWCPTKKDSHDSKSCNFAHHTRDFRRPPELFKYAPEDCETLTNGIGWDKCPKGLKCNKCHTTVERLYHPDKYKRIMCDKQRCNKLDICAFYHNQRERNLAIKLCKAYRKSKMSQRLPNINQLNEQVLKIY